MRPAATILALGLLATGAVRAQDYLAIERAEAVLLKSTEPRARRSAVKDLARLGSPKAIPLLVQTLRPQGRDPREDLFVRKTAAGALIALGEPAATALLPLVRDPSAAVRLSCIEILTSLRAEGLAELLAVRLREEPDPGVRSACISALATLGAPAAAIEAAATEDGDPRVRERAAAVLRERKLAAERPGVRSER